MGRHKEIIPLAPVKSFVKDITRLRVSEGAVKLLTADLQEYGQRLAQLAAENAVHRATRTIQRKDVVLATKQLSTDR